MDEPPARMIEVYLADDHAIVRDGLRFILSAEPDITVVGDAANGRQAVREVLELHPHVAVLDISMPILNGVEAARKIRETCPQTQVVILSMHATSEHIFRAFQAGVLGYLLKESAGREVVAAVRAAAAGRRYLSGRVTEAMVDDYLRDRGAATAHSPLERLSAREREVLQRVVEGQTSAAIAVAIHLSPKTVDTYRSRLMRKLGVQDLPGLVRFAVSLGLTPAE